jgi:archaeal flagellin FlaB
MLAKGMVSKVTNMERKHMEKLIGKYCKIITKEPGDVRVSVVTGQVEDLDYENDFIFINSSQGLGCIRVDTVIAIKPVEKKQHLLKQTQADIGIGTLIVFIAMVLVAAIAASVIMQTAETLQERAYAVGRQTIRDVSSGLRIIDATGFTDASRTHIQYLAIAITPRAGSYDLDMNKTLLYIQLDNFSVFRLNLNAKADTVTAGGVFATLDHSLLNATNFGMIALHDSDLSLNKTNAMSVGDQAIIMVNLTAALPLSHGLRPGDTIEGKLVPEVGVEDVFSYTAPNAFKYRVQEL